jgi:hypothetical protein
MKKIMLFMSAVLTAVVFCGCASFTAVNGDALSKQDISYSGKTIAHVEAGNWGIYLFHIPLLSGSTDTIGNIVVLQDTVTVANVAQLMTREAKKLGGKEALNTVTTITTDPFLFGIKEVKMSSNIVK